MASIGELAASGCTVARLARDGTKAQLVMDAAFAPEKDNFGCLMV